MGRRRVYRVRCRDCSKFTPFKINDFSCDDCKSRFDKILLEMMEEVSPARTPLAYYMTLFPSDEWQFVETYFRIRKSYPALFYEDGF